MAPIDERKPRKEIVIVDDETDILDMLLEDFQSAGYKVWCAENISTGLALIRSYLPPVVISDLKLPNGGGKDLFEEIKEFPNEARPKVVFITGNPLMTVEQAYEHGADGYITKPFVREKLVEQINWVIASVPERWNQLPDSDTLKKVRTLKLAFPNLDTAINERKLNLGRGGIFVAMSKDYPKVGDIVKFQIRLEESEKILKGDGFVRWVRQSEDEELSSGIGVEFRHLDPESSNYLIEERKILTLTPYIPRK